MAKDPICGMYVDETTATIKSVLEGRTYYFCATACKEQFDAPEVALRKNKLATALSWSLGLPILVLSYVYIPFGHYILFILAGVVQFYPGMRFYQGMLDGLRSRSTNMDTLIAIGTSTAFFYSAFLVIAYAGAPGQAVYFDASALIIALIRTGGLMEDLTKQRAATATLRLMELQPSTARRLMDGREEVVPVEEIDSGDLVIVRPGEKVPVDGIVSLGNSEVDQSLVTGETVPVAVGEGDSVIGGSVNTTGSFQLRATTVGQDSALSRIIELVTEAKEGRASIQKIADRVSSYFVPLVVSVALASALAWYFVWNVGVTFAVLAFVSVIVVACPCALGIATPAALMVGAGKGSENGILIKGGEALEISRNVDTVLLDKTGTITYGRPSVTGVHALSGAGDIAVGSVFASLEHDSEHPIARAAARFASESGMSVLKVTEFRAMPGLGVEGLIDGSRYWAGRPSVAVARTGSPLPSEVARVLESSERSGSTVVVVGRGRELLGYVQLTDAVRPGVREAVASLTSMGIDVIMLTGDNEHAASAVARETGISKFRAGLKPEDKQRVISELQGQGHVVAMVGDGVNDAPSLALADLGIAIGSGTDVAKASGNVILMKNDLSDVSTALLLGRKTLSKIKQNLFWAFAYNSVLIPVAAGVLVPVLGIGMYSYLPMLSALAMAFSSTTVVTNSLLLNRFDPRRLKSSASNRKRDTGSSPA